MNRPNRPPRRKSLRRPPTARDQHESAFAEILLDLVDRIPGARVAVLVDRDGETVDYAGRTKPYDARLAAAHWRLVLDAVREQVSLAGVRSLVVRAGRASFIVHALPDGYALIVALARGAGFRGWLRAVPACAGRLGAEAGWLADPAGAWFAVEVACDERRRPCALTAAGCASAIEVLGRYSAALPAHERAWRVRLDTGAEVTLVCESGGFWYTDEPPPHPSSARPPKKNI